MRKVSHLIDPYPRLPVDCLDHENKKQNMDQLLLHGSCIEYLQRSVQLIKIRKFSELDNHSACITNFNQLINNFAHIRASKLK
jgi:hypothetical protein